MRKMIGFSLFVTGLALGALGGIGLAEAGIAGTKHDLTASQDESDNVCHYCHVPHNAAQGNKIWSTFGNESQLINGPSSKQ